MADTTVLVDELRFPEVPRWRDGALYAADMFARRVIRVDAATGEVETVAETPGAAGGLGWLPDGRLLVVSMEERRVLRLEDDGLVEHADLGAIATFDANDMLVTASGRAYVGNFGVDFQAHIAEHPDEDLLEAAPRLPKARLAIVEPDGTARPSGEGLSFPNGMALVDGGRTLVVAESLGQRLTAFTVEDDGTLTGRRTWAELPGFGPDGICADAGDAVWFADAFSPAAVRVAEGGEILQRVETRGLCFGVGLGGEDGHTLFCCTAASASAEVFMGELGGRIETAAVDVPGAPA